MKNINYFFYILAIYLYFLSLLSKNFIRIYKTYQIDIQHNNIQAFYYIIYIFKIFLLYCFMKYL